MRELTVDEIEQVEGGTPGLDILLAIAIAAIGGCLGAWYLQSRTKEVCVLIPIYEVDPVTGEEIEKVLGYIKECTQVPT